MSLEFIDERDIVVTGGTDKQIRIWCVLTGKQINRIDNSQDSILCLKFDIQNELLFVGGYSEISVYAMNARTLQDLKKTDEEALRSKSHLSQIKSFKAHDDCINMI